jgi:LytS/YehU family sensor histidine kinase
MFTTRTTTIFGKKAGKKFDAAFEKFDSAFEKMGDAFKETEGIFESILEDNADDALCSSISANSDQGAISITSNNGHIIVEGKIKSLKINGKDISL